MASLSQSSEEMALASKTSPNSQDVSPGWLSFSSPVSTSSGSAKDCNFHPFEPYSLHRSQNQTGESLDEDTEDASETGEDYDYQHQPPSLRNKGATDELTALKTDLTTLEMEGIDDMKYLKSKRRLNNLKMSFEQRRSLSKECRQQEIKLIEEEYEAEQSKIIREFEEKKAELKENLVRSLEEELKELERNMNSLDSTDPKSDSEKLTSAIKLRGRSKKNENEPLPASASSSTQSLALSEKQRRGKQVKITVDATGIDEDLELIISDLNRNN